MSADETPAPHDAGGRLGRRAALLGLAVVAVLGFRLGVVPGGQVGVDVLLAAAGAWWAGALDRPGARGGGRGAAAEVVHRVWPAGLAAVTLAVGWVLLASSTAFDVATRGQGLALVGGYGNWHQLAEGPSDAAVPPSATPLQGGWAWAVLVQCALVWAVTRAATRPWAHRRPDAIDPAAWVALGLAALGLVATAALALTGSDADRLSLGTDVRAAPFLLGAAWTALGPERRARLGPRVAALWPSASVVVVVGLVVGGAGSEWVAVGFLAVVGPAAAILLVATDPTVVAEPGGGRSGLAVPAWMPSPSALLVAVLAVHPAVFALARLGGLPRAASVVMGLAALVPVALAVAGAADRVPSGGAGAEARRVLVPAAGFLLVVALFIVTGAFHWTGPQPLP